ncbi:MAG: ABC transporter permease [Oscillospiraceae bacterium]|jgi:putative ABC transport system permease protein|nr:ABC transporter permease [Oscillospiraceae bacterium]
MLDIILGAIALGLLWAVMALGVYITYRVLDVADLTVEGTIALGGAVAARFISGGMNPWLATLFALIAGLLGGLCTGLLHTKLKIPALLSGILTMIALYSINLRVMGKSNIPLLRVKNVYSPLQELGLSGSIPSLIVGVIIVVAVAVIIYWFFGTELGSAIRATGNNQNMARAQGINTSNMIILGLVISNGMVALSGALIAQYQSFADVQMGTGSIVIGLASLIIGEVLFGTRTFKRTLVSVSLGAIIYRIIIALVLKAGMDANDLKLFTAVTVAICLSMPMIKPAVAGFFHPGSKKAEGGN